MCYLAFQRSTQMDIFALVVMSPRRMVSILMLQVTASALLESLPVSTEAGRFLRVSTAVASGRAPRREPS